MPVRAPDPKDKPGYSRADNISLNDRVESGVLVLQDKQRLVEDSGLFLSPTQASSPLSKICLSSLISLGWQNPCKISACLISPNSPCE